MVVFIALKYLIQKKLRNGVNNGNTAICPYCGVDSIIYDNKFYSVDIDFLERMKKYWF